MVEYKGKQITIMACSDCNTKCDHCYISYSGNINGKDLYNMCYNLKKRYKVIINGSEILLHNDYLDALGISDQNRILTNGIIIYNKPEILKQIKKTNIRRIAISYHYGSSVSHVYKDLVKKTIDILLHNEFEPELMCTITKENYNDLESIVNKTIELNVKTLRLFNCLNTGNCLSMKNNICLNNDELKIFFKNLNKVRKKYDKSIINIKRNGTFGPDLINFNSNFKCIAGINEVIIAPDMNVYPCIYLTKSGYEIGKYIGDKVMLYDDFCNNGNKCLAKELFNSNNRNIPFNN